MLRALVATVGLVASTGCAVLADANAKHTSGGRGCNDDVSVVAVDVVLAAGATAALFALGELDESPAWLAVPGVFIASGTIGVFTTRSCRRRDRERVPTPSKPPSGPSIAPRITPVEPIAPVEPPPGAGSGAACSIEPLVECPPDHSCSLTDGNRGYCVPDS